MEIQDLNRELRSGKRRQLYIFCGEEHNMINRYIHKISDNPITVDSFKELKPKLQNLNLFSKGAVYVIKNDKDILDKETDDIVKFLKHDILILVYSAADKRKTLFKAADLVEFNKLDINTVIIFIKNTLPEIPDKLAEIIAYRCNCDMGRVEFELDKLQTLNEPITEELINNLIRKLPDDVVFDMITAVLKRNKKLALMYLQDLLELKDNPIPLLYRNFRNILLVQGYKDLKPAEISSKTNIQEKAVYAILKSIGHYTLEELIDNLKWIFETDYNIKTGREEQRTGTINLVMKLCRA